MASTLSIKPSPSSSSFWYLVSLCSPSWPLSIHPPPSTSHTLGLPAHAAMLYSPAIQVIFSPLLSVYWVANLMGSVLSLLSSSFVLCSPGNDPGQLHFRLWMSELIKYTASQSKRINNKGQMDGWIDSKTSCRNRVGKLELPIEIQGRGNCPVWWGLHEQKQKGTDRDDIIKSGTHNTQQTDWGSWGSLLGLLSMALLPVPELLALLSSYRHFYMG